MSVGDFAVVPLNKITEQKTIGVEFSVFKNVLASALFNSSKDQPENNFNSKKECTSSLVGHSFSVKVQH